MKLNILAMAIIINALFLTGCASVPVESIAKNQAAKAFKAPTKDKSVVYVYRTNSIIGTALKKDIWVDKDCLGESARGTFFHHEVAGNKSHTISTESEFSPNDLKIDMKGGSSYYVEQYIKMGIFVGGANLKQVKENEGKREVSKLKLAKKGNCSTQR